MPQIATASTTPSAGLSVAAARHSSSMVMKVWQANYRSHSSTGWPLGTTEARWLHSRSRFLQGVQTVPYKRKPNSNSQINRSTNKSTPKHGVKHFSPMTRALASTDAADSTLNASDELEAPSLAWKKMAEERSPINYESGWKRAAVLAIEDGLNLADIEH